jgi:hypothetical protein
MMVLAPLALALGLVLAAPPEHLREELRKIEDELTAAEAFAKEFGRHDPKQLARIDDDLDEVGERWLGEKLNVTDESEDRRREAVTATLARVRAAREELEFADAVGVRARTAARPAATAEASPAPLSERAIVEQILAERQFEEQLPPAEGAAAEAPNADLLASWWTRLVNWWLNLFKEAEEEEEPSWFAEWFAGAFEGITAALGPLPWNWIGGFMLALIAGFLLFLALRLARRGVPSVGPMPGLAGDSLVAEAMRHEADHFLAEGNRYLEKGDLRAAVRAFYVGVLSALHHRRLLELEPAHTNWEHVRRLAFRPEIHARVAPATRTFDWAWYGRLPVERQRVLEIARVLEELTAHAPAPPQPAAGPQA